MEGEMNVGGRSRGCLPPAAAAAAPGAALVAAGRGGATATEGDMMAS
jgi:hypothetical protein